MEDKNFELLLQEKMKSQIQKEQLATINNDRNIVKEVENENLDLIKKEDEFKNSTKKLFGEKAKADFKEEANKIANKNYENDLAEFELKQKKAVLSYQAKYEKKLIKQQALADKKAKEFKIAEKRYGAILYPLIDEKGDVVRDYNGNIKIDYSKFTPNKTANRFKEFEVTFNNLNLNTRKIIKGITKTLIVIGGLALFGYLLYLLFIWVAPFIQK